MNASSRFIALSTFPTSIAAAGIAINDCRQCGTGAMNARTKITWVDDNFGALCIAGAGVSRRTGPTGVAAGCVGTNGENITPPVVGETFVDILVAVVTPPAGVTAAKIATGYVRWHRTTAVTARIRNAEVNKCTSNANTSLSDVGLVAEPIT